MANALDTLRDYSLFNVLFNDSSRNGGERKTYNGALAHQELHFYFETRYYVLSLWGKRWYWHYHKMKMQGCKDGLSHPFLWHSEKPWAHPNFLQTLCQTCASGTPYSLSHWTWKLMNSIIQIPLPVKSQTGSSRVVSPWSQRLEEARSLLYISVDISVGNNFWLPSHVSLLLVL